MRTVVTADRLWNGNAFLDRPVVTIEDASVVSIDTQDGLSTLPVGELVALPGNTLAPAYFDVHTHGAAGHDVMEADREALDTIGSFLASKGVGSYLATTVTAQLDATLRSLEGLACAIAAPAAPGCTKPIGVHLEGPFLSHAKRGVHPPDLLLAPDIAVFDRLYEAAEGHVKLITIAPELAGAPELIRHATARGVRVSIGHSNATAAETRAALAAGAVSATHIFNAMRPLDHREPGILGVTLTDDAVYAELICDGIHVAPEMVQLWWKAKGQERAILVTDAMSAAGMPDGTYQLGGFAVEVAEGRAMANGVLAGSVLTLDRALANFVRFTGTPSAEALPLLTTNPARMTGLEASAGSLSVGGAANLVAVDAAGQLRAAFVGGKRTA